MKNLRSFALIGMLSIATSQAMQPENDLVIDGAQTQQSIAALGTVLNTFVSDLQSGDIDTLEKHLQEKAGALNVTPIVQFMQKYGPTLQNLLQQAVTEMPIDKFPIDWQKNVRGAQQSALSDIPALSAVISNLNALQPYLAELPSSINAISSALRTIKTTPEFETLKNDVATLYTQELSPALMNSNSLQFKTIKTGLDELAKRDANKPFKIQLIIMGFDEARRMFPFIITIIAQTSMLAEKITSAIALATSRNPLPDQAKIALDALRTQSATFLKSMRFLESESNKALGK